MKCKDCEYLKIPEDEAEAFCTARSKRGRILCWKYGFPENLQGRKETVRKWLERDVKTPTWCIKKEDKNKEYIRNRTAEIIQDYLFEDDEQYAFIEMYFEKKNGERQRKVLTWGDVTENTPLKYY